MTGSINIINETKNHLSDRVSFDAYDNIDQQHLSALFQQIFSKLSNENQTELRTTSVDGSISTIITLLPSSFNDQPFSTIWSVISLWFVLIINPILIVFGVMGNLCATYILLRWNIAKLPVSFYTIMLNISDTLTLLIPVFIFWLDNCVNRKGHQGYFRDKSNFLCKVLMCPDQLFAALSAWYMCTISFNRWCSVCRPSSFYLNNSADYIKKKQSKSSILSSSIFNITYLNNIKLRQHLKAFQGIVILTITAILLSCIPIFFHELRSVEALSDSHMFDSNKKTISHIYFVTWKRCYYSRKYEYIYDIIGILLSTVLHIIPLTFVTGMNLMIIVRLHKRQTLLSSVSTTKYLNVHLTLSSDIPAGDLSLCSLPSSPKRQKKIILPTNIDYYEKRASFAGITFKTCPTNRKLTNSEISYKNQSTNTTLSIDNVNVNQLYKTKSKKKLSRHCSRDRTITMMLVSVALSYLVLTLPYRLFWIWNVYVKRSHPELLNSANYLFKMHYIDHFLRTIRNINFATNFIFFIFLSKTFRRKFRQICVDSFKCMMNRRQNINNSSNIPRTNIVVHATDSADGQNMSSQM